MGFNISGICLDKNYATDMEGLERRLGWRLSKPIPATMETVSANYWAEGPCAGLVFTETGTLIFLSPHLMLAHNDIARGRSIGFVISETTDTYGFRFFDAGEMIRELLVAEGQASENPGSPLSFETGDDNFTNIMNGMERILGQSFSSLQNSHPALICQVDENNTLSNANPLLDNQNALSPEVVSNLHTMAKEEGSVPTITKISLFSKLFGWLFGKKATPTLTPNEDDLEEAKRRVALTYPERDANFLDQILLICQHSEAVTQANLAREYNHDTNKHELVLGLTLKHEADASLKGATRLLKLKLLEDQELFYASNITDPELHSTILSKSIPFYVKHDYFGFRELLTHWGIDNAAYAKDVELAIRSTPVSMIVSIHEGPAKPGQIIISQGNQNISVTVDHTGAQPYVPIFTDMKAMVESEHYKASDSNRIIEITIPDFNQLSGGKYTGTNFILNPTGTPMEFFFKL